MKKILTSPWTALVTLAVIVFYTLQQPTFLESVKLRYFDTLITSTPEQTTTITTVNIDEASLDKYGQWPFPRDVYGDIIKDLYARGAGLVVWNVLMPEQDRNGKDAELASIIEEYPVVLPLVGANDTKNTPRNPGAVMIGDPEGKVVEYPGILSSIDKLESRAYGSGVSSVFPEVDGVTRRIPLVIKSGDTLYPSMGLEVLRILAGDPSFQIKFSDIGIDKLRVPQFGVLSTDPIGRIWIDYQQRPQSYSLTNLPDTFDSGIVIVGTSAAGISNPIATSRGELWPQEMQAAVIATLASGTNIERPDWAPGAEILALILLSITLLFLTRWVYVGLGVGIVALAAIVPATQWAYASYLYLFDATLLLGGLVLVMLHAYGVKFVSEFLQKQQIKKQFGSYLSPDLVAKLQKQPDLLRLGGTRQPLTIMFTDVRGFTAISEHYGDDVEGLTSIMNRYMTAMTKSILENNGTLDKYIGDAQMAFWNAPIENEGHVDDAIKTALEMLEQLDEFNQEVVKEGIPAFGMGVGINTGVVVVGNMGSEQRFDYTCLGDSVNLASRLEGQSKSYGVQLIIGESTVNSSKREHGFVELDKIAVKGKTKPETIYTLGEVDAVKHKQFLTNYYTGDWKKALVIAEQLSTNSKLHEYYRLMAERLEQGCPKDWKGYYVATSK
jgi:adenylate cyclase